MARIVDARHGYRLEIPDKTTSGQPVTVQRERRGSVHVLHAESPDQSELYFEVAAYPGLADHQLLVAQQQAFLRAESADGQMTAVGPGSAGPHAGTTFDFRGRLQGRLKVRRFLFVDDHVRTYRVVHDPTSPLNVEVLNNLHFGLGD